MVASDPLLQLHLEPREPIEVSELTAALGSLARQYQDFAVANGLAVRTADAKLLVSTVSPGSIDISLLPDWVVAIATGPLLAPLIDKFGLLEKFAKHIKGLIGFFQHDDKAKADLTVKDCDDAINIAKPIAQHGGVQTFNLIKEQHIHPIMVMDAAQARRVVERATRVKTEIQPLPSGPEKKQRVSMTWSRLDRDKTTIGGKQSPDRAVVEEIDQRPHAVFFTDEMASLKGEMIIDEENPYQQVYFVDVEISRAAGGRVSAYRIVGYHGKESL